MESFGREVGHTHLKRVFYNKEIGRKLTRSYCLKLMTLLYETDSVVSLYSS